MSPVHIVISPTLFCASFFLSPPFPTLLLHPSCLGLTDCAVVCPSFPYSVTVSSTSTYSCHDPLSFNANLFQPEPIATDHPCTLSVESGGHDESIRFFGERALETDSGLMQLI